MKANTSESAPESTDVQTSEILGEFIRKCRVTSVQDLRKKGHVLVEFELEDTTSVQIVMDRSTVVVGNAAIVALAGATLGGQVVKRQKIAGEWSEGVLLEIVEDNVREIQEIADVQDEHESNEASDGDDLSAVMQILPPATVVDEVASLPQHSGGSLQYVHGDASKAQYGKGKKIIAHVCNDQGRWGKGFVMAITDEWGKGPGKMYRKWHKAGSAAGFGLGRAQLVSLTERLAVANIIGQNGIKTGSKGAPVRYEAIQEGLDSVCCHAQQIGASVHMPKIGAGLAGGEWPKVEAIIQLMAKKHGIDMYIYEYTR